MAWMAMERRRLDNGKQWKTMENNGVFAALQEK